MKEVMPYVLLPFILLMTGLTWGLYWLVLRPIFTARAGKSNGRQ